MKQYLELLKDVLDNGTKKTDRTGTGTLSVFGRQLRFNLKDGFPLITTKKLNIKSISSELLWFIEGSTNERRLAEIRYGDKRENLENKKTIWSEWKRPYTLRDYVKLKSKSNNEYIPLKHICVLKNININDIDLYLYNIWLKLIDTCYEKKDNNNFICEEWQIPENFIKDVKKLPHWEYAIECINSDDEFILSKDYYNSDIYSPETCVWLPKYEHELYNNCKVEDSILNRDLVCYPKGIATDLIRMKLIEKGDLGDIYGSRWRNWNGIDQLSKLIYDIKNNPDSRRLILSAWDPTILDQISLPACHSFVQFYVNNGELSCCLYQRSGDVLLGVPYNIASYSLLTHMIAQQCELEVGEFVWTGGDVHLYSNHLEQAKLQLTRIPYDLPALNLKKVNSIFDYKIDDISIDNYKSHPHIKAPVAI